MSHFKCHILSSILFLHFHLIFPSNYFHFYSKRRLNPQFWQPKLWTRQRVRGIRLHVCVMSHSLLPQGDEKRKVGRWSSCAMTCEKTPQLPHLGISVLLEVLIFSVVRCNASLLFVLLSSLRRQRINQAVSSHSTYVVSMHIGFGRRKLN